MQLNAEKIGKGDQLMAVPQRHFGTQHIPEMTIPTIAISTDEGDEGSLLDQLQHAGASAPVQDTKTSVVARCVSFGAAVFWIEHKVKRVAAYTWPTVGKRLYHGEYLNGL